MSANSTTDTATATTDTAQEQVMIFDTTLRDGEQSPGIALNGDEKLEIADQLARLGVNVIEAGFPVASQGDFESVQAIAKSVQGSTICGLCRSAREDIDRCWEAIESAESARIHTFIATSPTHMKHKLKMTPEQVKEEARLAVRHAVGYTADVEFSPEDASRSDFDFMCEVLQIAVDEGARVLNIPDTVGYAVPEEYAAKLRLIRERVRGDYVLSTHCHNDLGLAVANSLAGVLAGARQVECAVNGIGERAGNAALEEVTMAIQTRGDYFAGFFTSINTQEIQRSSRLVSRLTGYPIQYNKAVVGRNAFAHESGIHQHGVLNDPSTYEIMDPNAVGQEKSHIVLGKHSGRHAFADKLKQLGHDLQGEELNAAFARFKELADRKVQMSDSDLDAFVADRIKKSTTDVFSLEYLSCQGGSVGAGTPTATVTINRAGGGAAGAGGGADAEADKITVTKESNGMVAAACLAVKEATGVFGHLTDYTVNSVTGGVDALADVALRLVTDDGIEASGRGLSTDVVEASVRAFINAANKVTTLRSSAQPEPKEARPGHLPQELR